MLTITFRKVLSPSPHAWWEAERRTGGKVRGGYMPIGRGVIPHDLVHFATEAHLGIEDGFWGMLARGATFKRGTDQRVTRPGRTLIAEHRAGLNAAKSWATPITRCGWRGNPLLCRRRSIGSPSNGERCPTKEPSPSTGRCQRPTRSLARRASRTASCRCRPQRSNRNQARPRSWQ